MSIFKMKNKTNQLLLKVFKMSKKTPENTNKIKEIESIFESAEKKKAVLVDAIRDIKDLVDGDAIIADAVVESGLLSDDYFLPDMLEKVCALSLSTRANSLMLDFEILSSKLKEKGHVTKEISYKEMEKDMYYDNNTFDKSVLIESYQVEIIYTELSSGSQFLFFKQEDNFCFGLKITKKELESYAKEAKFKLEKEASLSENMNSVFESNHKPIFYYEKSETSFHLFTARPVFETSCFSIKTLIEQLK